MDNAGNIGRSKAARYSWSVGVAPYMKGPAGRMRPWAPQWMDHISTLTETDAVNDATNCDLLVAHPGPYRAYVSKMKEVNPRLILAVYMNGTFTHKTDLPESAYSHDANGNRISPIPYPETYMLNPSSPYVALFKKREVTKKLRESGYDGVLIDGTGTGPLKLTYVRKLPINPATGEVWTPQDWLAAVGNLVSEIKAVVRPRPIYFNSLKNGPEYFSPTNPRSATLTPGVTGSMAETWLREMAAPITAYPSESAWKQSVDMLADAGSRGYAVLQVTKIRTTATRDEKDAWYKYTLASWLLGNDGRAYFQFSYTPRDSTRARMGHRIDLGAPMGAYTNVNGVYRREFAGGLALVNPTSSSATVALGGVYTTLTGVSVTSVTLPPRSGEILRP